MAFKERQIRATGISHKVNFSTKEFPKGAVIISEEAGGLLREFDERKVKIAFSAQRESVNPRKGYRRTSCDIFSKKKKLGTISLLSIEKKGEIRSKIMRYSGRIPGYVGAAGAYDSIVLSAERHFSSNENGDVTAVKPFVRKDRNFKLKFATHEVMPKKTNSLNLFVEGLVMGREGWDLF